VALGIEAERVLGFAIDTCSVTRLDHLKGPSEGAAWRIVAVNQHPNALSR
jgi:alpha-ribazole phosphatase